MIRYSGSRLRTIAPALLLLASTSALAQTEVAPPPTPFADRLAEQMRVLAVQPTNVPALLTAAEMSARLDDADAARDFLARAEAASPGDPRAEAVRARMLVRNQRPGEALRLFTNAERRGVDPRSFADDRGFAYDLLGAPEAAQRDYRTALSREPSDEVTRRLALSLGISGKRDEAMTVLDPLLRRSDRAAWRARAFILALGGDAPGAERIAASMMPSGMGAALSPFFTRLPRLAPADQAFAVHFGELARTPSRVADAQLAPPLPAVERPVQLAAATTNSAARVPDRRSRRQRERDERQLQVERERQARRTRRGDTAPPVTQPAAVAARAPAVEQPPLPPPPGAAPAVQFAQAAPVVQPAPSAPLPQPQPQSSAPVAASPARVETAALPQRVQPTPTVQQSSVSSAPASSAISRPAQPSVAPVQTAAAEAPTPQPRTEIAQTPVPTPAAPPVQPVASPPIQVAAITPRSVPLPQDPDAAPVRTAQVDVNTPVANPSTVAPQTSPGPVVQAPAPAQAATTPLTPPEQTPASAPQQPVQSAPAPEAPLPQAVASTPPAAPATEAQADEVLAAIVRNITIPAAELGVAGPPKPAEPVQVAAIEPAPQPVTPAARPKPEPVKPEPKAAKPEAKPAKPEAKPVKPEAKPAKPDPKAAAKPPAKKEPPKPDPKKQEPARWWAQVAGGADVKALPKEWKKLLDKAPDVLKGRSPWTTPLRFTNRLLVGPFKSEAEAQSFVNGANKKGLSSFAWQSDAGQKIDKLPLK